MAKIDQGCGGEDTDSDYKHKYVFFPLENTVEMYLPAAAWRGVVPVLSDRLLLKGKELHFAGSIDGPSKRSCKGFIGLLSGASCIILSGWRIAGRHERLGKC